MVLARVGELIFAYSIRRFFLVQLNNMEKNKNKFLKFNRRKILVFIVLIFYICMCCLAALFLFSTEGPREGIISILDYIPDYLFAVGFLLGFPFVILCSLAFKCNVFLGLFSVLFTLICFYLLSVSYL